MELVFNSDDESRLRFLAACSAMDYMQKPDKTHVLLMGIDGLVAEELTSDSEHGRVVLFKIQNSGKDIVMVYPNYTYLSPDNPDCFMFLRFLKLLLEEYGHIMMVEGE